MEDPKIQLSDAEEELMQNAAIILTKNRVLEKMKTLLEQVQHKQEASIQEQHLLAGSIVTVGPKISKGEYYLGLPYLILDYPRQSGVDGIFFIRTMFWWGHFFSTTLHVSGKYKERYLDQVMDAYPVLGDFYIGIHEDPWVHHFEADNYRSVESLSEHAFRSICCTGEHLKIARRLPLGAWQEAREKLWKDWKLLLRICGLVSDAV